MTSEGTLNAISGSMVLMKGERSDSNLYMLQVDGGLFLSHSRK